MVVFVFFRDFLRNGVVVTALHVFRTVSNEGVDECENISEKISFHSTDYCKFGSSPIIETRFLFLYCVTVITKDYKRERERGRERESSNYMPPLQHKETPCPTLLANSVWVLQRSLTGKIARRGLQYAVLIRKEVTVQSSASDAITQAAISPHMFKDLERWPG